MRGLEMIIGEILAPSVKYPIAQEAERLIIADCHIGVSKLQKIDLHVPARVRAFYFDGPILTFVNSAGDVLERIAPIYVRL
jgi:hypothetical protein